jgi:hypothetical protein
VTLVGVAPVVAGYWIKVDGVEGFVQTRDGWISSVHTVYGEELTAPMIRKLTSVKANNMVRAYDEIEAERSAPQT